MNIAYRFRIYPNREQEVLLAKTFGCCRFLYNQMLNDKIREHEATKKIDVYKRQVLITTSNITITLMAFFHKYFSLKTINYQKYELRTYIEKLWEKLVDF